MRYIFTILFLILSCQSFSSFAAKPLAERFDLQSIAPKNQLMQAKVPAKSVAIEEEDDFVGMEIDVDASDNVLCELYVDGVQNAASQLVVATSIIKAVAEGSPADAQYRAEILSLEIRNQHIITQSVWGFNQPTKNSPQLARLFTATIETPEGATLLCWDGSTLGREGFQEIIYALSDSLTLKMPKPNHFYREVVQISLGEKPIGYGQNILSRDEENDIELFGTTMLLLTVEPGVVSSHDSAKTEYAYDDGRLINSYSIEYEGLENTTQLDFRQTDNDNEWSVEGTFKSKELNTVISTPEHPDSEVALIRSQHALLKAEDGTEFTHKIWISESPDTLQTASAKRTGHTDTHVNMNVTLGPIALSSTVLNDGSASNFVMQLGPMQMNAKTLLVEGTP